MGTMQTEKTHVSAKGFDLRAPHDALDILVTAQMSAAWSVRSAARPKLPQTPFHRVARWPMRRRAVRR